MRYLQRAAERAKDRDYLPQKSVDLVQ